MTRVGRRPHLLKEHLEAVGRLAAEFAPVVVPSAGCEPWLGALNTDWPTRERLRVLLRFPVMVPHKVREAWVEKKWAQVASDTVVLLGAEHRGAAYDPWFGLIPHQVGVLDPGTLITG
ncbi:hypothetical protein [Myxococcus landrumensis]|uniref:Uncharacterized protein n=1 Tax=Myxococcus landrumensis TaxID=2813577 RepID=A0ABX7N1F2_9BACT|nr:hypothetical protein [Myxococcus landrumus]QSQ12423.1 hypothetical protein JY572_29250 [Myxococcus landrumus]